MSKIWNSKRAGSGGPPRYPVVPFRYGMRRAARGHAQDAGCYGTRIQTQLYLECYCACRRHQDCHCRETDTSVRLRFLGSSRTSRCLPVPDHMGCRAQSAMVGRKLNAGHLLGVAQFANWRRVEALRVQSSRLAISTEEARARPGGERMFQLLISLIGAIVPICVEDRPISATHGAGKEEARCAPACRRKGVSNVHCGPIPSQSGRIQGVAHQHGAFAERNERIPRS